MKDAKHDFGKPHLSYVPSAVIWAIAYIREYGNAKYHNPYNWQSVEPERYIEALLRHVELYRENPYGYDEESGLPHLWHIACNVAFLCDFYRDIFNGELGIKNGDPLDFEKVSPYFWAKQPIGECVPNCEKSITCKHCIQQGIYCNSSTGNEDETPCCCEPKEE